MPITRIMSLRPLVLLVDDDPLMRDLLAAYFTAHGGFRITGVASDGFEGAMLACDIQPDIVVIDHNMPRWDGERAVTFIRERYPWTKIVALSSVLTEKPEWADEFVAKTEIEGLVPLVESLA
jgi:DNA-binding NarL/FixJ family response regulator